LFFGEILYPDPGVLNARIADLQQTAQVRPGSADLYLLLSYELMAAGRYDEVPQALRNAQSYANLQAIDLLKEVLDEIRRARPPTEY
jgi:cytochrome c-type biogenesis protein CcmH/NrfG